MAWPDEVQYAKDSNGNRTSCMVSNGFPRLLVIGDSRVSQGFTKTTASDINGLRLDNHGFTNWYRSLSKNRHNVINSGLSSRTAVGLAANDESVITPNTLAKCVINPIANDALIWLGTNDIAAGTSGLAIAQAIRTIANAAKDSGKRTTVICEISRVSGLTAAQQFQLMELQRYLYRYSSFGEFGLIDPSARLTDWAQTVNYFVQSGVFYDSTHPNAVGAKIIAEEVNNYYSQFYPSSPVYFNHHYTDDYATNATSNNRLTNGMYPVSLAGWTGASVAGAVTAFTNTRIASPDGYGWAVACDITVNAATSVNLQSRAYDATTAFVSGDTIHAETNYWIQGNAGVGTQSGVIAPYLRCDINTTGGTGAGRITDLWPSNNTLEFPQTTNFEGTLKTLPYYWTGLEGNLAPNVYLGVRFSGAGSARIIFGKTAVVKNNPYINNGDWVVS